MTDVIVQDHGSIVTFTPVTDAAREWFDTNVQAEPWQWLGGDLGVDARMAPDLIHGIEEAGLCVT